jgi:hypothetical protein
VAVRWLAIVKRWEREVLSMLTDHERRLLFDAVSIEIEAHPVARAVLALMEHLDRWSGTTAALLSTLATHAGDDKELPSWPKAANKLSGALKRVAPSLRVRGVSVVTVRTKKGSEVVITSAPVSDGPAHTKGSSNDAHT